MPSAAFFMMVFACSVRLLSSAVIHKIPPQIHHMSASEPRIPKSAVTTRPISCGMSVIPTGFGSVTAVLAVRAAIGFPATGLLPPAAGAVVAGVAPVRTHVGGNV